MRGNKLCVVALLGSLPPWAGYMPAVEIGLWAAKWLSLSVIPGLVDGGWKPQPPLSQYPSFGLPYSSAGNGRMSAQYAGEEGRMDNQYGRREQRLDIVRTAAG